jgi:hypothetical protein
LLALGAACSWAPAERGDDEPLRLHAQVVRSEGDTVRWATPAVARRCRDGRSLLLEAANEQGSGVLVLVRYGDSLDAGPFPLLLLGDSLSPRGAAVAVRYMTNDVSRGFALDSGRVELRPGPDALGARVRGTGLEGTVRVTVDAEYDGVPLASDSVPCGFRP